MNDKTYKEIMEKINAVKKQEKNLEEKVNNIDKAIESMLEITSKQYNIACEYAIPGFKTVTCKKDPKELSRRKYVPSCKYQWLHYGKLMCLTRGYKK